MIDCAVAEGNDPLLQGIGCPFAILAELDVPRRYRLERLTRSVMAGFPGLEG
jgi:hypothetical protein